jgi:Leucine-rich repeat (LRR) protein
MGALRSLKRLSLGDTALRRLPRTLGTIPLEELQLNGVRLEDWRDLSTLAAGGTLKHLWLSMNPGLERIPDPVFDLGSLEYLVLGATPIREIPGDIGLLENLRLLGLAGTQVRALPPVLGELPALKRVVLQNAPVPPDELARARAKWPHIEFEA